MSHQRADADFGVCLKSFLNQLASALVGSSATAPTTHYLARLYVRGIVAFATKFYDLAVPDSLRGDWSFAVAAPVAPIAKGDASAEEVGRTLHMDFKNYTLGRLFDDRANYDMNHQGHQAAAAHVLGVVWSLGWRAATFEELDRGIAEGAYRGEGRGQRARAERYGKKYGWIGYFTYAGALEAQGLLPDDGRRLSDVDIDPSFPEPPPVDGEATVQRSWLSPDSEGHEHWIRASRTEVPQQLIVREKIGEFQGPWVAVHGFVKAADKVLGREVWAFVSALVTLTQSASLVVAALNAGEPPWIASNAPSDHYTFAGEIPWHPSFAAEALADSDLSHAYRGSVRVGTGKVEVEALAHSYDWESYHSEMNQAGSACVPSRSFSARFDLRSVPQGFDQVLPDGTRATITLSGVDGLEGNVLYLREDLLRQYVGDRTITWFAFGERELHHYSLSPPQWLVEAHRQQANAWRVVLTDADLIPQETKKAAKKHASKKVAKKPVTTKAKKAAAKKRPPAPQETKKAAKKHASKKVAKKPVTTKAKKAAAKKRPPARKRS
jgi:hypothetical protein